MIAIVYMVYKGISEVLTWYIKQNYVLPWYISVKENMVSPCYMSKNGYYGAYEWSQMVTFGFVYGLNVCNAD